jgi:hypothetical protein
MLLASCAFMMNLEGGWKDKQVQKHIKTLGGYMDILRGQAEGKYRYRILAGTAEDLAILANQMKTGAPDSYYIRRSADLAEKAMALSTAASRQNAEDTKQAIDDLLALWEIFVQYVKPVV